MSGSGFLEQLLDGEAVEWKPIAEVFHLKNGYTPSRSKQEFWENGTVSWFRMDDIRQNGQVLHNSLQKVSAGAVKGGKLFPANSLIFSTSATIGEHALISVPHLANQRFTNLSLKERYLGTFVDKFLFYYGFLLAEWCKKNTKKSSFPSVDMDRFRKFEIPIPCPEDPKKSLTIQAEIVRILDRFTELTAELTAELNARRKQYKHYREKLLTLDDGNVERKPLGEVAEYSKTRISSDQLNKSNHVGVDNLLQDRGGKVESNHVPTSGNLTEYQKGDILIGNIRPYLKKIWPADRTGGTNGDVLVIHPTDDTVDPRYIYQVLADGKFFNYSMKHAKGAKMPRGSKPQILLYPIPIPFADSPQESLAEQARIVAILDAFDVLTTSLTEGLPREIDLRQKQYAYYRDLLLNFPRPDADAA